MEFSHQFGDRRFAVTGHHRGQPARGRKQLSVNNQQPVIVAGYHRLNDHAVMVDFQRSTVSLLDLRD